jgi:hypothetical protein
MSLATPHSGSPHRKLPEAVNLAPGDVLARKYEVLARLKRGEGLYVLSERATGIERTARFFTAGSQRRAASSAAQKLHRLRHCDILVPYRTQETISLGGRDVTFLVSDPAKGEVLRDFLARQPGGKLPVFTGLHLLHALAAGLEKVHAAGEYHGELGVTNLFVRRRGLGFQVQLLDVGEESLPRIGGVQSDVFAMLRIFYEATGGARAYRRHPAPVKTLCCGLRRPQVADKYRDAGALKRYLETMVWS